MRVLLALALILMVPGAAADSEAFFVGTGDDHIIGEPEASLALFAPTNFEISTEGHGGQATTYQTHPGNDLDENGLIPTFIYQGEPVTLTATDVLTVHHFAAMNGGDGVGPGCGLTAHLYDAGGNVLTEQFVASDTMTPGVQEFVFELSSVEGTFETFKLQFVQTGSGLGGSDVCGNMGIVHHWGSDDHPGRVVLPAPEAPVPEVLFEDLAAPEFVQEFANSTSGTYVINFTQDLQNITASFEWAATNGTIEVALNGPNSTLFEGRFEGTANQTEIFEDVAPGAWNLTVSYTNFTGTFGFKVGPVVEAAEADEGEDSDDEGAGDDGDGMAEGSDGGDGNATGNETVDGGADDKGSPAPALPMLAVGLIAAVATLRRRR